MAFLELNNNILDEMLGGIKRSRFVAADLSFQNQNVYFAAGFAQSLGIPVIYTCHDYRTKDIKFDTQHTNQIRWSDVEELRAKPAKPQSSQPPRYQIDSRYRRAARAR